MRHITVVVADEQPLYRRGVRWSLERDPGMVVIAEAADGAAALAAIERHGPAVALVQADLPRLDGLEVARRAGRGTAGPRVVLLAAAVDEVGPNAAAAAGAAALAAKGIEAEALTDLVRRVAAGKAPLADHARAAPAAAGEERMPGGTEGLLSTRELRILDLIAHGGSNRQIAQAMELSEQTVKNAVSSILRKLGVTDRTQAVIAALRAGWVTLA